MAETKTSGARQEADPRRSTQQSPAREPLAIVGIGCRFPGARGAHELWELLANERNAIGDVPRERFDIDAFYDPRPRTRSKTVQRQGGFLENVYDFDAEFFRISPREAARMDPQQRILLETCAEAFDDAYLSRREIAAQPIGVYVGAWASDWEGHEYADRKNTDVYSMAGSGRCLLSGRVSFAFDLRGPSLTVDTGCSASLMAAHLACQSLWLGESSLAIACGVNLILDPKQGITLSQGGMLAPDGQCKAFDSRADGLVRSEGCGAVVIMPLAQARARRARIYALIRGTGASNDGFSNGLLATPSELGQELALRAAYRVAGLSPHDVQYIEGHGTGTRAGDPVELRALGAVMRDRPEPCLVGSIKTNIGHTEGASGVAGLIKTALALQHRVIPGSLHCENPTPEVAWEELKLAVAGRTQPWPGGVARAGVSSFGISGTDVHFVLEEPPATEAPASVAAAAPREQLLVISGMSKPALQALASSYGELLERPEAESARLVDLCHSASRGRQHHDQRLAAVGTTRAELGEALAAYRRAETHPGLVVNACAGAAPAPVFVFSGQGSQWRGMGRGLLQQEPAFRGALLATDAALRGYAGWSLLDELASEVEAEGAQIDIVQPLIFAVQVALSALWRSWGIEPVLCVGHSMGEVAAAHVAGILSLDDAARIICRRSEILQRLAGQGSMLSVELGFAEASRVVDDFSGLISIAVCNSEGSSVLSGDRAALAEVERLLRARQIFCREVQVGAAAHSPQLDPLMPELRRMLAGVAPNRNAACPLFSTVTAAIEAPSTFDADYWVRNMREPVRFSPVITRLIRDGHAHFLEISPHPIVLGPITQLLQEERRSGAGISSLRRDEPERAALLRSLGQLHTLGHEVCFDALYDASARYVELPQYAWQRERFDELPGYPAGADAVAGAASELPEACVLGEPLRSALHPRTHLFQVPLSVQSSTFLRDHRVHGAVMLPGAAFVEMALQAARKVLGAEFNVIEQLEFETALILDPETVASLQIAVCQDRPFAASIRFYSAPAAGAGADAGFTLHATARARALEAPSERPEALQRAAIAARCQPVTREAHVRSAEQRGIQFGPAFQGVQQLWIGAQEALAEIALPDGVAWQDGSYVVHPVLLDACWQSPAQRIFASTPSSALYLPVGVDSVHYWGKPGSAVTAHARLRTPPDADQVVADICLYDDAGLPLLETRGLRLRRVAASAASADEALYELAWRERPPESAQPEPDLHGQTWLVLADGTRSAAARLVPWLEAAGARCIVASAQRGELLHAGHRAIEPSDPAAFEQLVADAVADPAAPLTGVLDLWPLDAVESAHATPASLLRAQELGVIAVAHLVQALNKLSLSPPRVWIATAGAQPLEPALPVAIAQAPVWGLARVLRYELPEWRVHTLDLSAHVADVELRQLLRELAQPGSDDQLALRGERRYALYLDHAPETTARERTRRFGADDDSSFSLTTRAAGILDNLGWIERTRTPPGAGEVEIEVSAAGLNFIDVMKAFGVYPGMGAGPIGFGGECAGTIRALGPDCPGLQVGQRVVAMADGVHPAFSRFVCTKAALTFALPAQLTAAEAAALPAVFLTAEYALHELGRLRAGERVLIHSASGGVGLAAVQLAQRAGAQIFATAGSPEKRELLRGLGIEHVFDSRSLDFAEEIMAATHGEGIDMVLNSLAGEAIPRSLSLLRDDGRFLEIGKRDIYEDMMLGLAPFKRGLSFSHIDIGRLVRDRPERMGALLRSLFERFEAGELSALPIVAFPIENAADAFRHMAQAKHVGKVVLSGFDRPELELPLTTAADAPLARADASYLISGGLGGLGLVLAEWLVAQGARQLVLLGRSQPTERATQIIAQLREQGASIHVMRCDISRGDEVARVFAALRDMPPLRGVVHAAAILDDGLTLNLDAQRFASVMAPKLLGAFHLHEQTAALPLDFFVLFSSAAAAVGSPGQGNYAAGNEFLDALAHHRRALGLTALSIDWGPWRESGVAVGPERAGRLAARGMGSLSDRDGLRLLERLMRQDRTQSVVLPEADFQTWVRYYPAGAVGMLEPLLRQHTQAAAGASDSLRNLILQAGPAEQPEQVVTYLVQAIRQVLRMPASKELDLEQPLNRFGIDSLMALELKNRIAVDLELTLPVSKILLATGLRALARELLELMLATSDGRLAVDAAPTADASGSTLDGILNGTREHLFEPGMILSDDFFEEGESQA